MPRLVGKSKVEGCSAGESNVTKRHSDQDQVDKLGHYSVDPMVFLRPPVGIKAKESTVPFLLAVLAGDPDEESGIRAHSHATGFRVNLGGIDYLITNWHVVAGQNPFTGEDISKGYRPRNLVVMIARVVNSDGRFAFGGEIYPLYDANDSPLWFEHPDLGCACDVVAFPFKMPSDAAQNMHPPANLLSRAQIPVRPGGEVFVVGYIDGYGVGNGFPIWRSGYLASEPDLDVIVGAKHPMDISFGGSGIELPAMFIDALTRHGMSGSPVFASFNGVWDKDSDGSDYRTQNSAPRLTSGNTFLGCYSARVFQEGSDALGICWKASAIEEVCRGKKRGSAEWREPRQRPID